MVFDFFHYYEDYEPPQNDPPKSVTPLPKKKKVNQAIPTSHDLVLEFHQIFKQPIAESLTNLNHQREVLRNGFLIEELCELFEAQGYEKDRIEAIQAAFEDMCSVPKENEVDLVAVADALGDLEYFLHGQAIEYGIPLDDVMTEIHASNLSKLDDNGNVIYRDDGKVMKGPSYFKPNLAAVLGVEK